MLGIHSLQEKMASQASFAFIYFQAAVSGHLRLSLLWYCKCLPLRRQKSFYSTEFSCCRDFKFQYNGLLYSRTCAYSSKTYSTLVI